MTNIAIFASGNGSNCENIIRYFKDSHDINISLVLCNNPEAKVLQRAQSFGVPTAYVSRKDFKNEDTVMPIMKEHKVDFIVLAGFLVLIPGYLLKAYDRAIVNIHPALLPKYGGKGMYGHHVHEAVKAAGETESGITIHWVTEEYDRGEIIAQFKTAIGSNYSPDDIADKIHVLEMAHFPKVIEKTILNK